MQPLGGDAFLTASCLGCEGSTRDPCNTLKLKTWNASVPSWHSHSATIKGVNNIRNRQTEIWSVAAHSLLKSRRLLIVSY